LRRRAPVDQGMARPDNVTPFRPRRPPPRPSGGLGLATHRGKAVLVHLLTLISFVASFFFPAPPWSYLALAVGVAGLAIAASNRAEAMPWARTHHELALRTIVIGVAASMLLSILGFIPGFPAIWAFYARLAVLAWASLRALIGLVLAILRKPVPNPTGPLV